MENKHLKHTVRPILHLPNGDFYEEFSTCYVESVVSTTKTGH